MNLQTKAKWTCEAREIKNGLPFKLNTVAICAQTSLQLLWHPAQLSWDACVRCHLATAGIFKCPDEYIAPGPDCSNRTLSVLWHAQHTLMGLLTVLRIHPTKTQHCARGDQRLSGEYSALAEDLEKQKATSRTVEHQMCPSAAWQTVLQRDNRDTSPLTCCKITVQRFGSEQQLLKRINPHLISAGAGSLG